MTSRRRHFLTVWGERLYCAASTLVGKEEGGSHLSTDRRCGVGVLVQADLYGQSGSRLAVRVMAVDCSASDCFMGQMP